MSASTVLSGKGQVVIPADLRRRLRLQPGARFSVIEQGGEIRLTPLENDRPFAATVTNDLDHLPRWLGAPKSTEEISRLSDEALCDAIAEQEAHARD